MPLAVLTMWGEQKNRFPGYYFCKVCVTGLSAKNKHKTVYPSLNSAIRSLLRKNDDLPFPLPAEDGTESSDDGEECGGGAVADVEGTGTDAQFALDDEDEPQKFPQGDFSDLVTDLALYKNKVTLLASRLKEKCLLKTDVRIAHFRKGMSI